MQNAQTKQQYDHTASGIAADFVFGGLGLAFSSAISQAWDAADTVSDIRADRARPLNAPQSRTNGPYELGVKQSLGGTFGSSAGLPKPKPLSSDNDNTVYTKQAEMEMHRSFKPRWAA